MQQNPKALEAVWDYAYDRVAYLGTNTLSITVMSVGMKEISIQPNGDSNARNAAIMTQKVVTSSKNLWVSWKSSSSSNVNGRLQKFLPGSNICKNKRKGVLEFFYTPFLEDPVIHDRKKFSYEKSKPKEWQAKEYSQNYIADYKAFNFVDGEGIRNSLYVSGCLFACEGCFNKAVQNFRYGTPLRKN